MNTTVTRLYDDIADLRGAVREIEAMGFSHDQISVLSGAADDTVAAATGGGPPGVTGGILTALQPLSMAGAGPAVAAGALARDAQTGLTGALRRAGVDERDARVYAEGVRRGGALASVLSPEPYLAQVQAAMLRFGGMDAATLGPVYRAAGWDCNWPVDV